MKTLTMKIVIMSLAAFVFVTAAAGDAEARRRTNTTTTTTTSTPAPSTPTTTTTTTQTPAADAFRKSSVQIKVVNKNGNPVTAGTLAIQQTGNEFLFGGNSGIMTSEENYNKFTSVFNAITLMEFWILFDNGARGSYNGNVESAKYIMNYIAERGKLFMSGHPIIYNLPVVTPAWVYSAGQGTPTAKAVSDRMAIYQEYLNWWVDTFDKVQVVDVVNEPLHYPIVTSKANTIPAETFLPYQWVKAKKPSLQRRINEYGLLTGEITDTYINQLKSRTNDFDIIGVQAHIFASQSSLPSDAAIAANLAKLATLGKPIHITEVSIPSGAYGWTEETQRDYLIRLYTLFFNTPNVQMASYWDISDNGAWNPTSGLWRADGSNKPAWDALNTLVTKTLRTNATETIPATGTINFTGYRGTYTINGQTFVLNNTANQIWTVVQ